jgi:hypothetical protein
MRARTESAGIQQFFLEFHPADAPVFPKMRRSSECAGLSKILLILERLRRFLVSAASASLTS